MFKVTFGEQFATENPQEVDVLVTIETPEGVKMVTGKVYLSEKQAPRYGFMLMYKGKQLSVHGWEGGTKWVACVQSDFGFGYRGGLSAGEAMLAACEEYAKDVLVQRSMLMARADVYEVDAQGLLVS